MLDTNFKIPPAASSPEGEVRMNIASIISHRDLITFHILYQFSEFFSYYSTFLERVHA